MPNLIFRLYNIIIEDLKWSSYFKIYPYIVPLETKREQESCSAVSRNALPKISRYRFDIYGQKYIFVLIFNNTNIINTKGENNK